MWSVSTQQEVNAMRTYRRLIGAMFMLSLPLLAGNAYGDSRYRWDIPVLTSSNGVNTVKAGGSASALAQDGSKITISDASGTFEVGDEDVTGGGMWTTIDASTGKVSKGFFVVTGLIRFVLEPHGHLTTPPFNDTIGDVTKTHAGLAHLRVAYDDGSKGILIISCAAPGAPPTMFEGITASKGFVDYWNHLPNTGFTNLTLFHLLSEEED
jgi:hypothetical protein